MFPHNPITHNLDKESEAERGYLSMVSRLDKGRDETQT